MQLLKDKELEGAADMVVEIISSWTRDYDLQEDRSEVTNYTSEVINSGKVRSDVIQGFFVLATQSGSGRIFYPILSPSCMT